MNKSKVLAFYLLVFVSCVCAKDLGKIQDVGNSATLVLKKAGQADKQSESELNEDGENLFLVSILTRDLNSTGLQDESAENKKDCAGGLFDFIQCVISRKIESFSLELSKLAMPTKQPEGFRLQTMDPKIEGSLEDWLQKFAKHADSLKEDCNDD